ncbi:MAG TPA: DUF2878 domain-containing protein [Gammaproteobacteria bacterium]|nr:DUF2878 domain-containing protein [Gammaproteobacteria bacterium]
MTHPITNFVLFQICWLANCVGAGAGWPLAGPLLTAVWIVLHLVALGGRRLIEGRILLAAAAVGYAADSLLVLSGFIEFPPHARLGGPSPLWMVALWVAFAATLRHALRWLGNRYVLGALLGAIGGPVAYRAGEALGAVRIPDPLPGLTAVSVEWLVAMPLLLGLTALFEPRAIDPVNASNETERSC